MRTPRPPGYTPHQLVPLVVIDNGRTVKVAHGFQMNCEGGRLFTEYTGEGPQTATIDGKFQILDGEIMLGSEMPATQFVNYSNLVVTEDAELWGGIFHATINPQTSSETEHIKTEKKLNIKTAFKISPHYNLPRGSEPYPGDWAVLQSEEGFTDGTNPTNWDPDHWTMYRHVIHEKHWMVRMKPQE